MEVSRQSAARAGLSWPLPDDLDDAAIEARLFTRTEKELRPGRPEPDWLEVGETPRSTVPLGRWDAGTLGREVIAGALSSKPYVEDELYAGV